MATDRQGQTGGPAPTTTMTVRAGRPHDCGQDAHITDSGARITDRGARITAVGARDTMGGGRDRGGRRGGAGWVRGKWNGRDCVGEGIGDN